ncbi:hypothetical protein [Lentzea sp. E54]|uniref:hypothetical protein n=1 Tax=Lentzea xerophila TaxID=3435883 RepID=UPI003DA309C9
MAEQPLPPPTHAPKRAVSASRPPGTSAEDDKAMLLGWQDVVEGMFEIEARDGETLARSTWPMN